MASSTDQIRDLQRDASGNFVYRDPDGAMVTVYAGSPTAFAFEGLWTAAGEIHSQEQARRAALASEDKPKGKLAKFWQWLRDLVPERWRRSGPSAGSPLRKSVAPAAAVAAAGIPRLSSPAPQRPSTHTPAQEVSNVSPSPDENEPPLGYEPAEDQAPASKNRAPTVATPPSTTPPGPKATPDTFSIKLLSRDPNSGEYMVQFADGIAVRVPPESPYAKRFDTCFAEQERIRRSLSEAEVEGVAQVERAPNMDREEQGVEIASQNAALLTGKLVALGAGSNGKPRFALEASGKLYPLPLTDKESRTIEDLANGGKLLRLQALAEPTTQITLRTVEITDGDEVVLKPFRDLIRKDREPRRRTKEGLELFRAAATEQPKAADAPKVAEEQPAAPTAPSSTPPVEPTPAQTQGVTPPDVPANEPTLGELADAATPLEPGEEPHVHFEELPPVDTPPPPSAAETGEQHSEGIEAPNSEKNPVVRVLIPAGDAIDPPGM